MKRSHKWIVGIGTSLSLGIAATAVYAQPGQMGGGMGPQMKGGIQRGMQGGVGSGATGRGAAGPQAAQQLMTPEERTAMRDKMRNAATPEERQKLSEANHAEMQQRAKDKGITLPEPRGPRAGVGPNFDPASK